MKKYFTCRPLSDVEKKNLAILEAISKNGPISRTDISKRLDLNMVTISNYVKNYISKSVIIETGQESSSGGRRPELIDLNLRGGYVIGVSIASFGIIGFSANLRIKVIERLETQEAFDESKVFDVIKRLIERLKVEPGKIKGIGVGVSSIMNIDSNALVDSAERMFSIPTFFAHDAMCAAFGEKQLNIEADVHNMLYMYSDIGCGIILHGDIYLGTSGEAGEISLSSDHLKEKEEIFLKDSTYLKPWSQDLGIVTEARRVIARGVGTAMVELVKGDVDHLTLKTVIEAAKRNDDTAMGIIEVAALNLGLRVAYLVNLFNPEVVVVGGGIEEAGDLALNPIKTIIQKFSHKSATDILKIIPSSLGKDSVALGAASLMIRELYIKM